MPGYAPGQRADGGARVDGPAELWQVGCVCLCPPRTQLDSCELTACHAAVLLKQLVASVEQKQQKPKPSIVDCRAGSARLPPWVDVCAPDVGVSHASPLATDYLNPAAFATNLLKCTRNDWQLDSQLLLDLLPSLKTLADSLNGVEVTFEFLMRTPSRSARTATRGL